MVSLASGTEEPVHSKSYMVAGVKQGGQQIILLRLRQGSKSGEDEVADTYHINRHGEDRKELIYAVGIARCVTMKSYNRGRAKRSILPGIQDRVHSKYRIICKIHLE